MYLDVNGTGWFLAAPTVIAQTTAVGTPSLVAEGKAGQTADIFQVLSDYGGTKYFWVDASGNTQLSGYLKFVSGASTPYSMHAPDTSTLGWYDSSSVLAMDLFASSLRVINRSFYASNSTDSSVYAKLEAPSGYAQVLLHAGTAGNERGGGIVAIPGGAAYFWLESTGATTYQGVTASGCSSFVGGICVASGSSSWMTTDTAQDVTATKSWKADQGFYGYLKFYTSPSASAFSWMEAAATASQLAWYDSSSAKRMYLDVNGTGWFLAAPTVIAQTTAVGSPSLVAEGMAGQTADIFQVLSDYGGTKYFWVDASGNAQLSGRLKFVYGGAAAYSVYAGTSTELDFLDASSVKAAWLSSTEFGFQDRSLVVANSGDASDYATLYAAGNTQLILNSGTGSNQRGAGLNVQSGTVAQFWIRSTGGTLYTGVDASGCSSFVGGICVASGSTVGTVFEIWGGAQNLGAGYTRYMSQIYLMSDTETNAQRPIGSAGTFRNLFARTTITMPANASLVFTLRKNGADTAITVSIPANSAAGTYSDTTHTVAFAQGDLWDIMAVNSGNGASAYLSAVDIQFN
jgi:hypothetical protein